MSGSTHSSRPCIILLLHFAVSLLPLPPAGCNCSKLPAVRRVRDAQVALRYDSVQCVRLARSQALQERCHRLRGGRRRRVSGYGGDAGGADCCVCIGAGGTLGGTSNSATSGGFWHPHDARQIETQAIVVAQWMFLAGRRSGWTQQSVSCSHLALAWLARRAGTLEWPRQAFSLLLTGSGDVSSRISAPACERWPGRVVYSTTAPLHDPGTRLVLAYRGGGLRRP